MKILVVGSGGRENAVCRKLHDDGATVFSYMKNLNPGIESVTSGHFLGDELDFKSVIDYALKVESDLVFVGPDPVLETPLVDTLQEKGISVASPSKSAARLETSKEYMRDLLDRHNVGVKVRNSIFTDSATLKRWIVDLDSDFVVKPIGLTGGKGVRVMGDHFSTVEDGIRIAESVIGSQGKVLIEEKLEGEEFSLQAFCDGSHVYPMPVAQDYKRAYEGDKGPNTGGMGAITDSDFLLPFLNDEIVREAKDIIQKIADAMKKDNNEFRGIIYAQFMATSSGPKIVEVNARFADPEGINVLSIMKSDLSEVLQGIADGRISKKPEFLHKATVLKYIVPQGYGSDPKLGNLSIKKGIEGDNSRIYYASVKGTLDEVAMTNSRALALVGISESIESSSEIVDSMIPNISGDFYVRRDIGTRKYIDSKTERMKELMG